MADEPKLTIRGGSLDGTERSLAEGDEVLIGSDAECGFCIDLPGVSPMHARVWLDRGGAKVYETNSPIGIYVNDDPVVQEAALNDGDILWLGPPGEEGSVRIECHLGQPAPVVDGIVIDEPPAPELLTPEPPTPEPVPADAVGEMEFTEDAIAIEPEAEPLILEDVALAASEGTGPEAAEQPLILEDSAAAASTAAQPSASTAPAAQAPPERPPAVAAPPPQPEPPPPPPPPPRPRIQKQDTSPPSIAPTRLDQPIPAPAQPTPPPAPAPPPAAKAKVMAGRKPSGAVPWPRVAAIGGGLLVLAAAGYVALPLLLGPRLDGVSPGRAHAGQAVTLSGKGFAGEASGNSVLFGSDKPGRVVSATATQIQVEVPELSPPPGKDARVSVKVRVGSRESKPVEIAVFQLPRIQALSPEVAMPGEEVVIEGSGWAQGAKVRFGKLDAEIVETSPSLKVRVPQIEGGAGAEAPVVVTMGADASKPVSFFVGVLPLVTAIEPKTASAGDLLSVKGKGFRAQPAENEVRIGGVPALVTSAAANELKLVVPTAASGADVPLEVRVQGLEGRGQGSLSVNAAADPIELRFVAEPFADVHGHDHAVLATALGPAFVLSASGGRSAAQRAYEAQQRLNAPAGGLKSGADLDVEARGLDAAPSVGLKGRTEALLEVTEEDAAAYNEDWTRPSAKGVTRARLAAWWSALARDLVLALAVDQKPQHTNALAPEARALADFYQAAKKPGSPGVPRQAVDALKPAMREALRAHALRVPASVTVQAAAAVTSPAAGSSPAAAAPAPGEPAAPSGSAATAPSPPAVPPLKLEGVWSGTELEAGRSKPVTVTIKGGSGTLTYEGALTMSVPLSNASQQKTTVRFTTQLRGGTRRYTGTWDGQKIAGKISSQTGADVGTFELTQKP